jgi:signal transduction histidine kinase
LIDGMGRFAGFRGAAVSLRAEDAAAAAASPPPSASAGTAFSERLGQALRSPLAYIVENAERLRAQPEGPLRRDYTGYAADIAAAGRHLLSLIDDLVDLQAIERPGFTPEAEPVDLADLARAADADEAIAPHPVLVLGERPALERAVGNLVGNARDHGRGRVTVVAERDGDRARISVADEGPGLTPEQAEHAFERFWRGADPSAPGSGLGLAIVRAIAQRHKGHVIVDGARFTIDLPAVASPHAVPEDTADEDGRRGVPPGRPG